MTKKQRAKIWFFNNAPELMWWFWTTLLAANIVMCGLGMYICAKAAVSGAPFILLGGALSWMCWSRIKAWDKYIANDQLRRKFEELYEEAVTRRPGKTR